MKTLMFGKIIFLQVTCAVSVKKFTKFAALQS